MNARQRELIEAEGVPAALQLNGPLAERLLVAFCRREVQRTGLRQVVLGLSGGIDSAVSLYLAVRALGPENVLTFMLPYATSAPESLADALACATDCGVAHEVIPITAAVDAYYALDGIPQGESDEAMRIRRGNKMARERMAVLFDLSQHHRALVLGASNKSEMLLGYGTLHGDMAHAINPLGDLYKTQVRQLAAHLGVPEALLTKAPTADLYTGQTDEDQLGHRYADLDAALVLLVDQQLPPEVLVARGHDPVLVERLVGLVRGSQFKRRPPVLAKLSARTIGYDYVVSRDRGS